MKKALISVIGLAGYNRKNDSVHNPVKYKFPEKNLEAFKYNMLELMIDVFAKEYEIIPIYTQESRNAQKTVFENCGKTEFIKIFDHPFAQCIENESCENSYEVILKKIDNILDAFSDEDEIIIDITHGWRHLPVLMIIDAIMHKLKNPNKIKKIYFAKEIEANKEYEIIDITEYLELTLFVMMLNIFIKNYTIEDNFSFNRESYENVKQELQKFREYVLSNSIKALIDKNGVIDNILLKLNFLVKHNTKVEVFSESIEDIKAHLLKLKNNYIAKPVYFAHYCFARDLFDKKYLLNSVTFLIESQSLLAREILEKADNMEKSIFRKAEKLGKKYQVLNTVKNFFLFINKLGDFRSGFYYEGKKKVYLIDKQNYQKIKEKCSEKVDIELFSEIIKETNHIRNSLAHIDMQHSQYNIERSLEKVLKKYENFLQKVNL